MTEIQSPAMSWSPGAWSALELLGQAKVGETQSALQQQARVSGDEITLLKFYGLIVGAKRLEITPRGREALDFAHMHLRLCSIASAEPRSDQARWMVEKANEGLKR